MEWKNLNVVLADAPAQMQQSQAPAWTSLVMFGLMGVIFYVAIIRPQSKKAKEHATLIASLKEGDKIVTSSGIVGIVVSVKERTASIRSADTKLEILKSAVSEITKRAGADAGEN